MASGIARIAGARGRVNGKSRFYHSRKLFTLFSPMIGLIGPCINFNV